MVKTAEANVVVALTSGWFGVGDKSVLVIEGETFHSNDPVVKKYPTRFGSQGTPGDHVVIEQATAAPGELRGGKVV